jgi:flagellar basal body-associated protein FliL
MIIKNLLFQSVPLFLGVLGGQEIAVMLILAVVIIVIVVAVVNAGKRREQRREEALRAMYSQNNSNVHASKPNFRIEAIRNLKELGQPFDEYDIELEVERIITAERELEMARKRAEYEAAQARINENKETESDTRPNTKWIYIAAILIIVVTASGLITYYMFKKANDKPVVEMSTPNVQDNSGQISDEQIQVDRSATSSQAAQKASASLASTNTKTSNPPLLLNFSTTGAVEAWQNIYKNSSVPETEEDAIMYLISSAYIKIEKPWTQVRLMAAAEIIQKEMTRLSLKYNNPFDYGKEMCDDYRSYQTILTIFPQVVFELTLGSYKNDVSEAYSLFSNDFVLALSGLLNSTGKSEEYKFEAYRSFHNQLGYFVWFITINGGDSFALREPYKTAERLSPNRYTPWGHSTMHGEE